MNLSTLYNPEDIIILIIDDLKQNLKLLNIILEAHNFQTSLALSGRDGLERLKVLTPDLILLDLMMEDISGLEVCRQIKSQVQYQDIPIMFLTASNEESDLQQAYQIGAVDYLTKPFNKSELLTKINTQVTLKAQAKYIKELETKIAELQNDEGFTN